MNCKICTASTQELSVKKVLGKYDVHYFQCVNCGFVQTEKPYWLEEAYSNAITRLDIGLVSRNNYLASIIPDVLDLFYPSAQSILDYGGGYGLLTRMMRDKGYNFYRQDIYCQNLFAANFDIADAGVKHFDVLTTFEVFEHLDNPLEEMEKMFSLSDEIIFTTELLKENQVFNDWWYVAPETGQHIAFYTQKSLAEIAKHFKKSLYTNGHNLHVLGTKLVDKNKATSILNGEKEIPFLQKVVNKFHPVPGGRPSLLQSDFDRLLQQLKKDHS